MIDLIVHTIIHNKIDENGINKIIEKNKKKEEKLKKEKNVNIEIKIWNEDKILSILKNFDKRLFNYYNKLIINKSKEDIAKYVILYKYGGLFINLLILEENPNYCKFCEIILEKDKDILFFNEQKTLAIERSLLKKESSLLNDNIIYIKNKKNRLMNYIIKNIDKEKVPINQYQTKLYTGSYFLTDKINIFYYYELDNKEYFENSKEEIEKKEKELASLLNYSSDESFFNSEYIEKLYPNTVDLMNPTTCLGEYDKIYNLINYISFFGVLLFYFFGGWMMLLMYMTILAIGFYFMKIYICSFADVKIKKAEIDNKIFYNQNKFPIFNELKENWKEIKNEAENVIKNAPMLDIYRDYEDWHNSEQYVNKIKDKHGWIRSWKYKNGSAIQDCDGNYNWLNYGLLYFGTFFENNCDKCPKTKKILEKIKDDINICGFSYFMGNTTIEIHNDETGPSNNSMALHLGLIIPKNNETCKLIMKIDNDYYYETEKEGEFIIFDATNDHYAYNQSNEDRIVLYIDFKHKN